MAERGILLHLTKSPVNISLTKQFVREFLFYWNENK